MRMYVICGNKGQFGRFCLTPPDFVDEYEEQEFRPILKRDHIRGLNKAQVFLVGTYYDLPEWKEIREELRIRQLTAPESFFIYDSYGNPIFPGWY